MTASTVSDSSAAFAAGSTAAQGSAGQVVAVFDFGAQYGQLIARRVRDLHVYSEIVPCDITADEVRAMAPSAIILSGGPASVYAEDAPKIDPEVLNLGIPVLGFCYGHQTIAINCGGVVGHTEKGEYGPATLERVDFYESINVSRFDAELQPRGDMAPIKSDICQIKDRTLQSDLLKDTPDEQTVWMSHLDAVTTLPEGFRVISSTETCPVAAMECAERKIYSTQFHPEVKHTQYGNQMLSNFLFNICGLEKNWNMDTIIEDSVAAIQEQVGDKRVILGLSGGVDS